MKSQTTINFIKNTAKDYDMSFAEVERIFDEYYSTGFFYEELEKFIKHRREQS